MLNFFGQHDKNPTFPQATQKFGVIQKAPQYEWFNIGVKFISLSPLCELVGARDLRTL